MISQEIILSIMLRLIDKLVMQSLKCEKIMTWDYCKHPESWNNQQQSRVYRMKGIKSAKKGIHKKTNTFTRKHKQSYQTLIYYVMVSKNILSSKPSFHTNKLLCHFFQTLKIKCIKNTFYQKYISAHKTKHYITWVGFCFLFFF